MNRLINKRYASMRLCNTVCCASHLSALRVPIVQPMNVQSMTQNRFMMTPMLMNQVPNKSFSVRRDGPFQNQFDKLFKLNQEKSKEIEDYEEVFKELS